MKLKLEENQEGIEEVRAATNFGNFMQQRGDELDSLVSEFRNNARVRDFIDGATRNEDDTQAASSCVASFLDTVRTVFDVNEESGIGEFN